MENILKEMLDIPINSYFLDGAKINRVWLILFLTDLLQLPHPLALQYFVFQCKTFVI